jgi:hypothetical protein
MSRFHNEPAAASVAAATTLAIGSAGPAAGAGPAPPSAVFEHVQEFLGLRPGRRRLDLEDTDA